MTDHRGLRPATTPPEHAPARYAVHDLDCSDEPERGIYVTRDGRWVVWDAHRPHGMIRSASRVFATLAAAQRHVLALNRKYGEKTSLEPRAEFLHDHVPVPANTPPGAYWESDLDVYVTFLERHFWGRKRRAVVVRTASAALGLHLAARTPAGQAVIQSLNELEALDAKAIFDRLMAAEKRHNALIELCQLLAAARLRDEELDPSDPRVAELMDVIGWREVRDAT